MDTRRMDRTTASRIMVASTTDVATDMVVVIVTIEMVNHFWQTTFDV